MDVFDTTVYTIRFLSADAVERATCGHPGTPMALAGITTELFAKHLRYNPRDPAWPNRDRFVLSCGHASMLLYSVLHLAGFALEKDELVNFRQWGSKTPGHPELGHTEGVETTTGPLGQGVSNAVGMALGARMLGARLGSDVIDYRVFVLASDGDLMEGVASEAASLAGHWGLDNLVVIYDQNNITIDGKADDSFTEDVGARFSAYGWEVSKVDGHDKDAVSAALTRATASTAKKPKLIVARTHIGIGLPTKQDSPKAHGAALGRAEIDGAKKAVGWPLEEFVVPEASKQLFRQRVEQVLPEYEAWNARVAGLTGERKAALDSFLGQHKAPKDLFAKLVAAADTKTDATRNSGGRALQTVAAEVPALVSGSADLAGSTKTDIVGSGFVQAGEFGPRNFHYGVREHGMGAVANGLALSGFIPVVSTFLIFSDYMRPTLRLASMMQQRVVYVYTHDSFFVGEDGPTHQPIEQLSSLRLIPGLDVWRPADSLECAAAWAEAIERPAGPSVMALTRQNLPSLERPAGFDPASMRRGAYVVRACETPTLVMIATGSEVHVAVEAAVTLETKGHRVRVVSMPCVEAFSRWPAQEQEDLLGPAEKRVSIEAGATTLWRAVVGLRGLALGIDRFGASAPAEILQDKFGLNAAGVVRSIEAAGLTAS
jgi:transketolase